MEKTPHKSFEEKKIEVADLTSKILRILYYVIVVGIILIVILIFKELKIFSFMLSLFKIISPLFIGFIIAWIFNPLVSYLNKKGLSRILATSIVYVLFILLMYLFVRMLIPTISNQMNDLINIIPSVFSEIKEFITKVFDGMKNIDGINVTNIKDNVFASIENFAANITTSLPNTLITTISAIFSGLGIFLVSLIVGFYMLFNFDNTSSHILSLLPKKYRYEFKTLTDEIGLQLHNYVNGTLICAGIICITCTIGFALIGLKAPLLFGLFCGITNIIPYIGPYIGGIPAILVGFSQGGPIGILSLIIVVVIQGLEGNLLNPIIMSKTMKLHPVTVMMGLIVFGYFFGMWGMILATPIIALIKILINFIINKYDLFDYDNDPTEIISLAGIKKARK